MQSNDEEASSGSGSSDVEAAHLTADLRVETGQESKSGPKPHNDDRIGVCAPDNAATLALKGVAFVICDGVSAAEAGGEAADKCVRSFLADYFSMPDSWSVETSAKTVLTSLNRALYANGRKYNDPQRGFLCTLSALVVKSRMAHLFHVGDSRVYRVRNGALEQLTDDHKLKISKTASYLSRAMGLDLKVEIDYRKVAVEVDDVFIMTTDGVHDFLTDEHLLEASASRDLEAAARQLVDDAIQRGSDDNASCQLVRVLGLPAPNQADVYAALTSLPFPPDLAPGVTLDGYRVLRCIHSSPRSQLYAVLDTKTNQTLAMKTPSVNFDDDAAYLERFVMESWIGSRVKSAYVIGSIMPRRRQTFLYHLQEYVDGLTLERWMAIYPSPDVGEAIRIVEQIGRGLGALHRREIIHRDLKPDNVMIDRDGRVKLIDLGACYVAGVNEIEVGIQRDSVVGTASYSAPELILGGPVHPSSDQFSLGVLAYELLTGHLPYEGQAERAWTVADVARRQYVPAYHYNPMVPTWMNAALRKAVQADPLRRYDELSEFIVDLSRPNPNFAEEAAAPLLKRSPVVFWRTLAIVLLVLNVLTSFFYFHPRATQPENPTGEPRPTPRGAGT